MDEALWLTYVLGEELDESDRAGLLEYCFERLDASQSPPDESRNDLNYIGPDRELVSGANFSEAVEAVTAAQSGGIWFWYDDLPVGLHLNSLSSRRPDIPALSVSIDDYYLKPYQDTPPSRVREFVLELYHYLRPIYVYGDTYLDESSLSLEGIRNEQIEDVFWVNGFGPEMVDSVGRDRLRNAPVWRVDEREDGGIFLWVTPKPHHPELDQRRRELATYFGLRNGE